MVCSEVSVCSVYYCFHVAMHLTVKGINVPIRQPERPGGKIATPLGATSTDNGKDYEDKDEETKPGVILCNNNLNTYTTNISL